MLTDARMSSQCARGGVVCIYHGLDANSRTTLMWMLWSTAEQFREAGKLAPVCSDRIQLLDYAARAMSLAVDGGTEAIERLHREAEIFNWRGDQIEVIEAEASERRAA
jgi:hypothetical protein